MIGIDVVEIDQIKNIYEKHGRAFLDKILTVEETDELLRLHCRVLPRALGIYFAAKEAIFKAVSDDNLSWKDIVLENIMAQPRIHIRRDGWHKKISLTFSFTRDIVMAQALVAG